MFDILKGPDRFSRSLPALPHKRKALETLNYNLTKVVNYRRTQHRAVNGSFLLSRLLGSLNVNLAMRDEAFVEAVSDQGLRVANSLRLTSPWSAGQLFSPGVFYGPHATEVIIATVDSFDPAEARAIWEQLEPIRALTHSMADFSLPYLDGSGEGILGGNMLTVIVVNVAMLAFQYKCWWEKYVDGNPDSPPGMNLFFGAYPLANMLSSHLDITMANRLMCQARNMAIVSEDDPNPFYLNYAVNYVSPMLGEALDYMRKRTLSFDDWISAMPMATVPDYHDRLVLPDLAFITQMEWAIFVSRLPILGFLLWLNAEQDSSFNQQYVNNIRHWVRRMKNGRLFSSALRGEAADFVMLRIAQTIDPYL